MSDGEEGVAADLLMSGVDGGCKRRGTAASHISVDFELDGKTQKLPMPALINLRAHPDEAVRHRAYDAENAAWEGAKEILAATLNGVKGETITLNNHRGRKDPVDPALDASRIDRKTLDAMLGAIQDSFRMFRKSFLAKAKKLGKEKGAWWDIFAPLGKTKN